jgi:hypothetical protein
MVQHHDGVVTTPEARDDFTKHIMLALMGGWNPKTNSITSVTIDRSEKVPLREIVTLRRRSGPILGDGAADDGGHNTVTGGQDKILNRFCLGFSLDT